VLVVLNNSTDTQNTEVKGEGIWRDRWNDAEVSSADGKLAVSLPPRGAAILVRDN